MNAHICELVLFGNNVVVTPWKLIGMVGALMFASRWFVQAYYSRRAGRSITPRLFWILSLMGSVITLMYFILSPKQDMIGVLQNLFPFFIAVYNLYLDGRHQKHAANSPSARPPVSAPSIVAEPVAE